MARTPDYGRGLFLPGSIVQEGTAAIFPMPPIAPGLRGYAIRKGRRFYVGAIEAENVGEGALGRWLDRIRQAHVDVRFSTVISTRLKRALYARGWRPATERLRGETWTAWRPTWRCL